MANDYARKVSEALIGQLERGVAPWQKPWRPGERHMPYNPTTEKDYRGINTMWLSAQGYDDSRWLTYRQAAAIGAQVRKGEKGTVIEYWKLNGQEPVRDAAGNPVLDENGKIKQQRVEYSRPRVFHAVVFNAQQIDGMPERIERELAPEPERHAVAEAIIRNSGAKIQHVDGDRAFYSPRNDAITLPLREQFPEANGYYATTLHELGHWTGHPTRLDRDLSNPFGSEGYAKEELRAEIASLMMGDRIGLGHDPDRHAAYVGSWVKVLREDPREIFRAASDAEKIAAYVIGLHQEQVQFTEQDRAGTLQELVDLRSTATQAARDSVDAIAEAGRDEGMTSEEVRDAKAMASAWRDEAQATLANAIEAASPDVKDEWNRLNALEEHARNASTALDSVAFNLELARLSPAEQDERQASYSGSMENLLTSAREAHDSYVEAHAAIDGFVAEKALKLPAEYGAINVYTNDAVRVALQAAHEAALPSYSPLESWENIQGVAEEDGLTAGIRIRVGDSTDAPYQVQFVDRSTGALVPMTADIYRDGKAVVHADGQRLSPFASEDHDTQRLDLQAGFARIKERQHNEQLASNVVAIYDEFQQGRAGSDKANPALHFEHVMHSYAADAGDDARAAANVLMLDSQRIAKDQGIPVEAVSFLGATLRSYADAEQSDDWRALSDDARREATTAALEGREQASDTVLPAHFSTLAAHREAHPIGAVERAPVLMDEASMQANNNRVFLAVPFREKDEAKAVAKAAGFNLAWDKDAKAWSAPADVDLSTLSKWRLESAAIVSSVRMDPEEEFGNALRDAGFLIKGNPVMDGQLHRVAVEGDTGAERSGAYKGFLDGHPAGFIQNFRGGTKTNWKSEAAVEAIDPALRAKLNAEAEERRVDREKALVVQHAKGATVASAVFASAIPATPENAYLAKKGITGAEALAGLREVPNAIEGAHVAANFREAKAVREANPGQPVFVKGDLLVGARDFDGELWSLQSVNAAYKSFMTGGRKAGLHTMAGTDKPFLESGLAENAATPLVVVEGYATGDTVSRALGHPVIVAFDSGNLMQVAKDLRTRFPDREIVIAGDNDHKNDGQLKPDGSPKVNEGRVKAEAAALAVSGVALLPTFAQGETGSDWNDVEHKLGDVEGVRLRLNAGLSHAREAKQQKLQQQQQQQQQTRPGITPVDDARKKARGLGR